MKKRDRDLELKNPESWMFSEAEARTPTRPPRAVVSVAFSREDIAKLERHAKAQGLKLSQFIRDAALARIEQPERGSRATFMSVGGPGHVIAYFEPAPASSAASGIQRDEPSSAA